MRARKLAVASLLAMLSALAAGACDSDPDKIPAGNAGGAAGEVPHQAGGAEDQAGGAESAPGGTGSSSSGAPGSMGGSGVCPEGPPGDPPGDYLAELASGTRLEARYFTAPGLPQVFAGFFDTELDDWCDFMIASDDKLRCLPRGVKALTAGGHTDAMCEGEVMQMPQACAGGPIHLRRRLECLDKAAIHLAEAYSGPVYYGSGVSCTGGDAAEASSYTVGAEVPPTDFVEGVLVDLPGVCQGSLRVVEAEDGARGPYETFDIATGAACEGASCTPRLRAFEEPGLFIDDTCETPATEGYATWNDADTCAPPEFVRPMMNSDIWYRAGALSEAELYSGLGGCVPARDRDWIGSIYELGEPFDLGNLAPLEGVELGTARLRAGATAEAGIPLLAAAGRDQRFYDSELSQDCSLRELVDGTWRCIPSNTIGGTLVDEFNDDQCTQPLRRCADAGSGCAGEIRWDDPVVDERCTSTPPTTGIWRFTEPATGYYRESPGFPCYAGGTTPEDAWQVEAVDPSDLAGATVEVAP